MSGQSITMIHLGFFGGITAVFLWANFEHLRFMRFWLRPPYKRLTVVVFRVLFAAWAMAGLYDIVSQCIRHTLSSDRYFIAALIAFAIAAIARLMLDFAERRDRAHAPSDAIRH